jgi:hypothetical protein
MGLVGTVSTTQILSGTTTPTGTEGSSGDVYLQVDANGIVITSYQKDDVGWQQIGAINAGLNLHVPTLTPQGGAITSVGSRNLWYRLLGQNLIFVRGFLNIVDRGTATGFLAFDLPAAYVVVAQGGTGSARESSVGNVCDLQFMSNLASARINKYDGTTVFTANNVFYYFSGIYEFQ